MIIFLHLFLSIGPQYHISSLFSSEELRLTAVVLYGHKHKCFEGRLTDISPPFNKAVVVASLLSPVTSLVAGFCPGLQYYM